MKSRPAGTNFSDRRWPTLISFVVIASGAIPVTDPFLIDRVVSIAEGRNCQPVICINKCDLDAAEELYQTYRAAGFPTLRVSETGRD